MKRILFSKLTLGFSVLLSGMFNASHAQLPGGNYTINSGQPTAGNNYTSFNDAITAMSSGISGAVIFNVTSTGATYNEQVIIPAITGSSFTNTISINGNGNTLSYATPTTNERATLKLNAARFVTVKNLTVQANGPSYGFGIQLINNADNNKIDSCTINLAANTLNYAGICVNGSASLSFITNSLADSNTISNNTINGGYYGITLIGDATNRINGNIISGNTLVNSSYCGIYVLGTNSVLVEKNDLSRATLTALSSYYGIYLNSGNQNAKVSRNKVHNFFGSLTGSSPYSAYGIYSWSIATAGNENIFSNNIIYDMNGDGIQYGFYNVAASYNLYYYNSVSSDNLNSVSGNTYGFYQTTAASGIQFKNNIVSITRSGTGNKYGIYMNTAATSYSADHNDYYISGTAGTNNIGSIGTTAYPTLAGWQAATTQDAASLIISPLFTAPSSGNLLPNSSALDNHGIPFSSVPADINNITRSTMTPDIGAYEFTAPVISISGNVNLCSGTTTVLTGSPLNGTWSSSNPAIATIDAAGMVSALSNGTTTVTYTTNTGSSSTVVSVTTTPVVSDITGTLSICLGDSTELSNATPGGNWTSSNQFIGPITTGGVVHGIGGGVVIVTYTVTNGICAAFDTATIVVNHPVVGATTGGSAVCAGNIAYLSNSVSGGVWQSSDTSIATIDTGGVVTSHTPGLAHITYTVSVANCSVSAYTNITVNALPSLDSIGGLSSVCSSDTIALSINYPGGTWSSSDTAVAIIDTNGIVTGIDSGSATITYTATNQYDCTSSMTKSILVNPVPSPVISLAINIFSVNGAYTTYQWYLDGSPVSGATSATYTAVATGDYKVKVTNASGCEGTSAVLKYTVPQPPLSVSELNREDMGVIVFPNPAKSIMIISFAKIGNLNGEIFVIDALGRNLQRATLKNSHASIDVSLLNPGNYILKVVTLKGTCTSTISVIP